MTSLTSSVYPQSVHGAFVLDFANAEGLVITIMGGAIYNGGLWRGVPQSRITLQDNVTNHVYVSQGNAIGCSVDAVPASGFALYDIAVAGGGITSVVDQRTSVTDLLLTPAGPLVATKILTDAQIKALPVENGTGPIQLVSAPGVGKVILPSLVTLITRFSGGGYTGVTDGTSSICVGWGSGFGAAQQFGVIYESGGSILTFAGTQLFPMVLGTSTDGSGAAYNAPGDELSKFENIGLFIQGTDNSGTDWTGGDPANTLEVTVQYAIINV